MSSRAFIGRPAVSVAAAPSNDIVIVTGDRRFQSCIAFAADFLFPADQNGEVTRVRIERITQME